MEGCLSDITNSPRPKPNLLICVSPFDGPFANSPPAQSSPAALTEFQQNRVEDDLSCSSRTADKKRESPSKKAAVKRCVRKRPGLSLIISSPSANATLRTTAPLTNSLENQEAFRTVASKITDFMFVGGIDVAKNLEILQENGITHVINMCGITSPNFFPDHFEYLRLSIRDHTSVDISPLLFSLISFIEQVRQKGGVVLIHCAKGISRSTTVSISYLMWSRRWTLNTAFRFVKSCRNIINPNSGFFFQLNEWGAQLVLHRRLLSGSSTARANGATSTPNTGAAPAQATMFRVRVMKPHVSAAAGTEGYSALPAIEGPFSYPNNPIIPFERARTVDEQPECLIFTHSSSPAVLCYTGDKNADLLEMAGKAGEALRTLDLLPVGELIEYFEGSEPESIAALRSHFKVDKRF